MAKDVVRSGVTFDKSIYDRLDNSVKNSKRFKIDKSEIINTLINNSRNPTVQVQKLVMDYREKEKSKKVMRSGVTFDKINYQKLNDIVQNSKRFKIDKSEIINALINNSKLTLKEIQKQVMDYREK